MINLHVDDEKQTVRQRRLGRLVAGATALSMVGALAMGSVAFAQTSHEYQAATITVESQANTGATYDAYKVFDADIDGTDTATHIDWASDAAKTTTLGFLNALTGTESYAAWLTEKGFTQTGAAANAQNAAEFISERIQLDTDDTLFGGNPAAKVGGSFADRLAQSIAASSMEKTTTASDGVVSGTEGYYLIVATPASIGADEGGSAPMWVAVGGSLSTVSAKEANPSITFRVKEDKTGTFGGAADSNRGQSLDYKVVASLPDNIGTYAQFHDRYVFTLPAGVSTSGTDEGDVDASVSSFSVSVGGEDATSYASIAASGNVVTIEFADLKAIDGLDVAKGDTIEITYQAHLNDDAVIGAAGQSTTVARTYTNNPVTLADGTATVQSVKNFTYQAAFTKIDKSNHMPLQGAKFTIQASTNQGSIGNYVQADGTLGSSAYEFETDENGQFSVQAIDEGTYTIVETHVPNNYINPDIDTALSITSALDTTEQTITFNAQVYGGEAAEVEGDEPTKLLSKDASAGLASVQIVNERAFVMPLTGLQGNLGLYVSALILGIAGAGALFVGARRDHDRDGSQLSTQ